MLTDRVDNAKKQAIGKFLKGKMSHAELIKHDKSQGEITSLLVAAARDFGLLSNVATIDLVPPNGATVGDNEYVVVVLDELRIRRLFSNSEHDRTAQPLLGSKFQQEGNFTLDVNGQSNSVSWQRGCDNHGPVKCHKWAEYLNKSRTVLFAGKPKGFLRLDLDLQESEASEAKLLERIKNRLGIAASAAGLVPGLGTIVSAGLSLGAAIAELVKSNLDDDRELSYLGFIGQLGDTPVPLKLGQYHLSRITEGETDNDIDIKFSVQKLVPPNTVSKNLTIVLESVDLSGLHDLKPDDRVLLEATITAPAVEGIDAEPTINAFSFEHPYLSKKEFSSDLIPFESVVKLRNQLLYDGPWGPVISFNIGATGIPRDLNTEEWLQVLGKTGEVIGLTVDETAQPGVQQGFQIAQNAAGFLAKYLPDIRFSVSKSGLFVIKGDHTAVPDCLIEINASDTTIWQNTQVKFTPDGYGTITFNLAVKVTDVPPAIEVPKLPATLLERQTSNTESDPWTWQGGGGIVEVYGVWNGATITLQQRVDNATSVAWNDLETLTSDGITTFEYLAPDVVLRVSLQNAAADTDLTCMLNNPSRDQLLTEIRLKS